jgi:hypothetical protein
MVFHVNGLYFQLEPNAFAIPAGRKLAAFDAGNFMFSRVLRVMGYGIDAGIWNFFTRRVEHVRAPLTG